MCVRLAKMQKEAGSRVRSMRLTVEQRLVALERDNVVLHDTIKLLHKLLKQQRELISEYITRKMTSVDESEGQGGNSRPEDALFTFVCKQKFDRIAKDVENIRKLVEDSRLTLKAG